MFRPCMHTFKKIHILSLEMSLYLIQMEMILSGISIKIGLQSHQFVTGGLGIWKN